MNNVLQEIAQAMVSIEHCRKTNDHETLETHTETILDAIENYLPKGSGINAGVDFNWNSKHDKLIFDFVYEPIYEGQYQPAIQYHLIVTPSFINDFQMFLHHDKYKGNRRNVDFDGIEDLIFQTFESAFRYDLEKGE